MELRIAAFFAANISSFILYLAFSRPVEKIYKLEADNIGIVVEFLYVVPLIVILVLSARYGNQMQSLCILATSFLYIYPWIMNTSALLQMWMGLLKPLDNEKKPEEMRKEEEKTQQKKNSEDVESGLNSMRIDEISKEGNDSELDGTECDICCIRFDGKIPLRTPRILTECGHTYCEECIDKFLKQDKIQYAICPLCQQITVVDGGSASQLPKNYGMLKLIC
uniref:RING-type domain-containing protein n=1 Tax=Caenorhabditis tropicalis TaxID=1561998 RepID=A0A1I7T1Y2_9PELO